MIEIIPNFHPIFVHFTVALLSVSTLLFVVGTCVPAGISWKNECLKLARLHLWAGTIITIATVAAGWYAYNTVTHDGPSHAAMTDHKNWAFATTILFAIIALWSFVKRKSSQISGIFIVTIIIAFGLLGVTAFKGGEAVYRYGLGVMSLPQVAGDGGHGSHEHPNGGHGKAPKYEVPKYEVPKHKVPKHETPKQPASENNQHSNMSNQHGLQNAEKNSTPATDGHSNHVH